MRSQTAVEWQDVVIRIICDHIGLLMPIEKFLDQ
jgi:hypothetical protein